MWNDEVPMVAIDKCDNLSLWRVVDCGFTRRQVQIASVGALRLLRDGR